MEKGCSVKKEFYKTIEADLEEFKSKGLYKQERVITSPQGPHLTLSTKQEVLNFCANNYLGLANDPRLTQKAKESIDRYGYGLASVRFICGTQEIHLQLEEAIARFLGTESAILFSSCFDANAALFEALLTSEDAIFSDALNHASIIDGIRLCKAKRYRFAHSDMENLEAQLKEDRSRFKMIATDGVFSMDGEIANLPSIVKLAEKYDALTMIDDCHATGFLGPNGRGTHEYYDLIGNIDLITGTLGKALGGGSGGYIAGKKSVIDYLRQKARPYLFSNTLCPSLAYTSLEVFKILESEGPQIIKKLFDNSSYFRDKLTKLGFELAGKDHPIIPVMIKDASLTMEFAQQMLKEGIYVIGFCYPVVPLNAARIRTQMCALHSKEDLDRAINAFEKVGKLLKII